MSHKRCHTRSASGVSGVSGRGAVACWPDNRFHGALPGLTDKSTAAPSLAATGLAHVHWVTPPSQTPPSTMRGQRCLLDGGGAYACAKGCHAQSTWRRGRGSEGERQAPVSATSEGSWQIHASPNEVGVGHVDDGGFVAGHRGLAAHVMDRDRSSVTLK